MREERLQRSFGSTVSILRLIVFKTVCVCVCFVCLGQSLGIPAVQSSIFLELPHQPGLLRDLITLLLRF